jgi:hypothetical protein
MRLKLVQLTFAMLSLYCGSTYAQDKSFKPRDTRVQNAPWAGHAPQKKVMDINGDETTVFLSRDTLRKSENIPFDQSVISNWYKAKADLVGYGYRDRQGRSYGIWKYYIISENKWQLYCEGYYTMVDPDLLQVDPDIEKRFPTSFTAEAKREFVKELKDRLLFTGEWRFYVEGRLNKILVLDDKATIPYLVSESADGTVTLIRQTDQGWRRAGTVLAGCHFSASGQVKKISTRDLSMEFDNNGKPVILPLPDID